MDLIDLYSAVITSAGWEINSNGRISGFEGPVEVAGKQLVMPTSEILRAGEWDHMIAFHPLSENVMRGESAVLFALRTQMQFKLNMMASVIIGELTELAADVTRQKTLTIKQKEYLKLVPEFDAKTVKTVNSLLDKANPSEPEKIISLYVKRSGQLGDKKYNRVGTVHSPMRSEDTNSDRTIFGVKFRKGDFLPFFDLFDVVLPDINENLYSIGSNSMVAPSFHALLGAFLAVAKRLNTVLRKFQKIWGDDFEELLFDVDWEEAASNLDQYKGIIPNLRGNEGSVNPEEIEQMEEAPKRATMSALEKQKASWGEKQKQVTGDVKKMTLSEKLAQKVPSNAPANGFSKPANNFNQQPVQEKPGGKVRFQDMFGGGQPQQQQHVRQSTPYQQNGFVNNNNFGNTANAWAQPQQQQPMGRQSTPYTQSQPQRGGWGAQQRSGW